MKELRAANVPNHTVVPGLALYEKTCLYEQVLHAELALLQLCCSCCSSVAALLQILQLCYSPEQVLPL